MTKVTRETHEELRNEDPISGDSGSHPVCTGVGAAIGGAAAGALAGAVGGPVGAVVGAAVGAVAGGYGGKAVAESIDPTVELEYWKDNYRTRPYYDSTVPYSEYESAYRFGATNYRADCKFDDCETDLRTRWESDNPKSKLTWENAKLAMQDAWHRITGKCCTSDSSCKS